MTESQNSSEQQGTLLKEGEITEELVQQIADRIYHLFLQELMQERERDGLWNDQITRSDHHALGGLSCW